MNNCNITLFKHFYSVKNCKICKTLTPWKKFNHKWKGSISAKAMIISEAPGSNSIDNEKMWSGASGQRIRNILRGIGYNVEDLFFLTDVVKCLPENNRDPLKDEIKNCTHYLQKEIEILKPKYILSFGRFALDFLAKLYKPLETIPNQTITQLHTNNGYLTIPFENFKVFVVVHPSAAGRWSHKLSYENYRKHMQEIFTNIIAEQK